MADAVVENVSVLRVCVSVCVPLQWCAQFRPDLKVISYVKQDVVMPDESVVTRGCCACASVGHIGDYCYIGPNPLLFGEEWACTGEECAPNTIDFDNEPAVSVACVSGFGMCCVDAPAARAVLSRLSLLLPLVAALCNSAPPLG